VGVSLLVVSTIPMRKIHTFSVPPNMVAPLLALLAIGVTASILYGYLVILVFILAYVIHIPFAVRTNRWLAAHPETWDDKPRQRRAIRRAHRALPAFVLFRRLPDALFELSQVAQDHPFEVDFL
jgi:CDP-diacylglycerol--serine O-phosphatidyltransferase